MKRAMGLVWCLATMALGAMHAANAANVTLSVPQVLSISPGGGEISVPVDISDVTDLGVFSIQFRLTYEADAVEAASAILNRDVAAGASLVSDATKGQMFLAIASAEPLTGSGALVSILFDVVAAEPRQISFKVMDALINEGDGIIVVLPGQLPGDANQDGSVDILDLVVVGTSFGRTISVQESPNPDVTGDGIVNISDLVLIGLHFGESTLSSAPARTWVLDGPDGLSFDRLTVSRRQRLRQALAALQPIDTLPRLSHAVRLLGRALALHLQDQVERPSRTRLLPNYPNPLNPETWIPYQLDTPAAVVMHIYDARGRLVRQLDLGHQETGYYTGRGKAAYWDGRNSAGEPVASGICTVRFQAGSVTAMHHMLVVK